VLIMLAMPFTAVGAIWGMKILNYNMSIAVWAGMMEVIGIGAALCALITTYMGEAYEREAGLGRIKTFNDLYKVITEGATRALRPAIMTCSADILGLMPAMWATGIGAEFLKRYTVPIIFGLFTALILALVILPTFYVIWRGSFGSLHLQKDVGQENLKK
jgi:copper/silver efflux system protein